MKSYNYEDLKQLHLVEVDILKNVAECCNKFGLKYFIAYGTALGAVRHSGFIPWDDDIDIGMRRKDYDFFCNSKEVDRFLNERGLYIMNFGKNRKCSFCYAKVCKMNTEFVEYRNRFLEYPQGIAIDIFPFDNLPPDDANLKTQLRRVHRLARLFVFHQTAELSAPSNGIAQRIKQLFRRMVHSLIQIIPASIIYNKTHRLCSLYNDIDTGMYGNLFYSRIHAGDVSKDMIDDMPDIIFEGYYFKCPHNIDEYLHSLYNDYNTLPPEEKRLGHRPYKILF